MDLSAAGGSRIYRINPKLVKILLLLGLIQVLCAGIWISPRALGFYYQLNGGQLLELAWRSEEEASLSSMACSTSPIADDQKRKQVEQAIFDLSKSSGYAPSAAHTYLLLGKAYCRLGEAENAASAYLRYTQLRPENRLGKIELGFAYEAMGDQQSASKIWYEAGLTARSFLEVGEQARLAALYPSAARWYERSLRMEPELAEAWLGLGKMYAQLNRQKKARHAFQLAHQYDAGISTSSFSEFLISRSDFATAENILRQALLDYPVSSDRIEWWRMLGELLSDQKEWDAAVQVYQEALEEFPNEMTFHLNLGWAYYEGGAGVELARAEFEKVTELSPESGAGYFSLAQLFAEEQDYDKADTFFQLALSKNPNGSRWTLARANTALEAANLTLAIKIYEELMQNRPDFAPVYYEAARAYYVSDQLDLAVWSIENALSLTQSPNYSYSVRAGEIYESAGSPEKALTAYQEALSLNPDGRTALQGLERLKGTQESE